MEIKDFFRKINTIEDAEKIISSTEDGENDWLEFKGVHRKLKGSKKESAQARVLFAKEICAFANTDGGILIIGVNKSDSGLEVSNCEDDLEGWFDANAVNMLEPKLHGFSVKSINLNGEGNNPIAVYIPKSDLAPHRVKNNYNGLDDKGKDISGEYFVRRGTKSERLDENLIRAMYLSRNRIPNIRIVPVVEFKYVNDIIFGTQPKEITIKAKIFPDKYIFIKDYFFRATATLYDKDRNKLLSKDISGIVTGYNENSRLVPIFPAKSSYVKNDLKFEILPATYTSMRKNVWNIAPGYFEHVRYIQISLMYSCEAVSAKEENFLFIINNDGHFRDDISGFGNIDGIDDNIFVDDSFPDDKDDLLREIESLNDVPEK